jgi:hypothetical protein
MKDLDGQGFKETFDWMEENGLEGKVSVRWEELGSYYWDNVTGPVHNIYEAVNRDVSFILIYRADTNRGIEEKMITFARSENCSLIFVKDHMDYDLVWLYEVNEIGSIDR